MSAVQKYRACVKKNVWSDHIAIRRRWTVDNCLDEVAQSSVYQSSLQKSIAESKIITELIWSSATSQINDDAWSKLSRI